MLNVLFGVAGLAVVYLLAGIRILRQYERGVVFTLGHYTGTKGPGIIHVPPLGAHRKRVSLRVFATALPAQDVITRDNISVTVNAVLYFRVSEPMLAIIQILDYR